jgi:hypothetical protein
VRSFARHWSATDPPTKTPPLGLLPYRPPRAQPYFYSDQEIRTLRRLLKSRLQPLAYVMVITLNPNASDALSSPILMCPYIENRISSHLLDDSRSCRLQIGQTEHRANCFEGRQFSSYCALAGEAQSSVLATQARLKLTGGMAAIG